MIFLDNTSNNRSNGRNIRVVLIEDNSTRSIADAKVCDSLTHTTVGTINVMPNTTWDHLDTLVSETVRVS